VERGGPSGHRYHDCDDTRSSVHPYATEICDGRDNDCDGGVDEMAWCPSGQSCQNGKCLPVCVDECVEFTRECINSRIARECMGYDDCLQWEVTDCSTTGEYCDNGRCVDCLNDGNCGGTTYGALTCRYGDIDRYKTVNVCSWTNNCYVSSSSGWEEVQDCGSLGCTTATNPDRCNTCSHQCDIGDERCYDYNTVQTCVLTRVKTGTT